MLRAKNPCNKVQNTFQVYMNAFVTSTIPPNIKDEQGIC